MQSGFSCVYYVEQLVRHAQPALKEQKFKKNLLEGLHPLKTVLADLEVDMRTNLNHSYVSHDVLFPVGGVILIHMKRVLGCRFFSLSHSIVRTALNKACCYGYLSVQVGGGVCECTKPWTHCPHRAGQRLGGQP